jgi:uncharacterized secreted protein with C-terminal beta-propeller domain
LNAEEVWEQAHQFLHATSPTAATTWAHTWGEFKARSAENTLILVCYKEADNFLVEAFASNQWWEKVKVYIATLLDINPDHLKLELKVIKEDIAPKSIIDQQEENSKNLLIQRKADILENVGVRQIETLFNTKVDKVQLK